MHTTIEATFLEMSQTSTPSMDLRFHNILLCILELLYSFVSIFGVKDRYSLPITSGLQMALECHISEAMRLPSTHGT